MITQSDLLSMQQRLAPKTRLSVAEDAAEDESDLQEKIIRDARGRGWWVHFSRMDLPTTSPLGTPDLFVWADKGRVFIIETKSRHGKIRPAQLGVKLCLEKLGHTVHIVRSFSEYLNITTL